MAELVFVFLCFCAVTALAMRRAPLWLWAVATVVATYLWQSGLIHGQHEGLSFGLFAIIAWIPALALSLLSVPSLRRTPSA